MAEGERRCRSTRRRTHKRHKREGAALKGGATQKSGGLEPSLGFVEAVLVAEMLFENARFGAGANDLQGDDDEKKEQEIRAVEEKDKSEDSDRPKNINWIAKARIEAAGDETTSFRSDGERVTELNAGDGQEKETNSEEDDASDAEGSPRRSGVVIHEIRDAHQRDDRDDERFGVH